MTPHQISLLKAALPFAVLMFFASTAGLVCVCWSQSLGPIAHHRDAMGRAILRLLIHDAEPARAYWSWLVRHDVALLWVARVALPTLCSAVAATCFFFWYMSQSEVRHASGPIPLTGRAAIRHARKMLLREARGITLALHVHPQIALTTKRELGNILVTGVSGGGKSVIEKPIVASLIARGDRCLIYDQKSEYLPLFYDPQNAVIINPPDARSSNYDLADDCRSREDALMVAEIFVPMAPGEKNPVWTNGARAIVAGCIIALQEARGTDWGWCDLREALAASDAELNLFLKPHSPEAAQLIDSRGGSQITASYRSTILSATGNWLPTLARAWPNTRAGKRFSIRRWLTDKNAPRVIILPNSPEFSAVSAPLCMVLISLLVARVLALPDSNIRRIWLILDELANLIKMMALAKWLELSRSKGGRVLAGFQSFSQIQEIYGEKTAETLLGLFHTIISMRCGQAGGSSKIVSEAFGQRQVKRLSVTDGGDGRVSTNWQTIDEPVVRAETLEQLPQPDKTGVTGYLSVAGWNAVYRLVWPYKKLPKIAPEFVEASWVRGGKAAEIGGSRTVRETHGSMSESGVATREMLKKSANKSERNTAQQRAATKSRLTRRSEK